MNLILKKFLSDPINVGAIKESSKSSAKKMADLINNTPTKNVIEIGSGTGILSSYLEEKNLTLVEKDDSFCNILSNKYPKAKVVNDCGFNFLNSYKASENFGLFTSIPLIKKSSIENLTKFINSNISTSKIDWFIILGYRFEDSFVNLNFKSKKRYFNLNNLPPAFIWKYFND